MRLYLIAIFIAVIGLWISSEVRAAENCGLRSANVLVVAGWQAEAAANGAIDLAVTLKSMDEKPIRAVGGTVAFFLEGKPLMILPIALDRPVNGRAEALLHASAPQTERSRPLLQAGKVAIDALACIDSIDYVDGSGVIIN